MRKRKKMGIENIKKSMKIILKNRPYLLLATAITLGSGYLLYLLSNVNALISNNSALYVFLSLSMAAVIALLFGINVALVVYKFNISRKIGLKENTSGALGLFGGALASGCPVCGAAILGYLGLSGGLAILPFKGLEIKTLSLGLLLFATYKVSESITSCNKCEIRRN